jgi:two-component system nitrogen regulation sensor histidine kinase NtrY
MNFSFRARPVALITATVAISVLLVGWLVEMNLNRSFEIAAEARTGALVDQFRTGFEQRGEKIASQVDAIANSEALLRIAMTPDVSAFVNDAQVLAANHQLDLLEILSADGTIISSAQWPARFGYKETWTSEFDSGTPPATSFLKREQLPDGEQLAIVAVRALKVRGTTLIVVGGQVLDDRYFQSFGAPFGLRPIVYRYSGSDLGSGRFIYSQALIDTVGIRRALPQNGHPDGGFSSVSYPEAQSPEKITPFLNEIRKTYAASRPTGLTRKIEWTSNPEDAEMIYANPLTGRNKELLGVMLVGAPVREQIRLARHVRNVTLAVGSGGILFGVLLSAWLAGRVTRPVEELAAAASKVAQGKWE